MKRFLLALSLAALGVAILSAVPVKVTWAEGKVEKKVGSGWASLDIGDTIDSADTIRLQAGAFAELAAGARKLAFSSPGVYVIDTLLKASASAPTRSAALDKLSKLVTPTSAQASNTVGGVRGAFEGAPETMTWVDENEDALADLEAARKAVTEGRYPDAVVSFGKASELAEGDTKLESLYGKAWSLTMSGRLIEAVKVLRAMPVSAVWKTPRALLLARVDLDTGAAFEAKTLLEGLLASGGLSQEDTALAKAMLDEAKAYK